MALYLDGLWCAKALRELEPEAINQDRLAALRTHDTADAKLACTAIGQRQHDVGGGDPREFGKDHSRGLAKTEFLKALKEHLNRPLLIIWDGLRAHRSQLVRDYLDSLHGHIQLAYLPPYSPDLNPVEYLWAWLKRHALANFCPANRGELHLMTRNKLKSAQRRTSIIMACWKQAELW